MIKAEIMEVLKITEEQINMLININGGNVMKVITDLEKMAVAEINSKQKQ